MPILVQLAFMFFAVTYFSGSLNPKKEALAPAPLPGSGIAPPPVDDFAALDAASLKAVSPATPTPEPGFFDAIIAQASGKRLNVPAELVAYESARVAALESVGPKAVLTNSWAPGTAFSLYVVLSESAERPASVPLGEDAVPAIVEQTPEEAAAEAARAAANAAPAQQQSTSGGLSGVLGLFGESTIKRYLAGPVPRRAVSGACVALADAPAPAAALVWAQHGLTYSFDEANYWEAAVNVTLPARVVANASRLWAHVFLVPADAAAAPEVWLVHPLVKLLPYRPRKQTYNLIGALSPVAGVESEGEGGGEGGPAGKRLNAEMAFGIGAATPTPEPTSAPAREAAQMRPYWKPTLAVQVRGGGRVDTFDDRRGDACVAAAAQIVPDWSSYPGKGLPPHVAAVILVAPPSSYKPLTVVNDFWQLGVRSRGGSGRREERALRQCHVPPPSLLLQHHLIAINDSVAVVPLTLSFAPQGLMPWSMMATMERQWEMQAAVGGAVGADDAGGGAASNDLIKTVLLETNPVLLAVTMAVSLLHMVFDFLAFKNDISFWRRCDSLMGRGKEVRERHLLSFWRSAKTMEGLSVRAIGVSFFFQLVILLYLIESETSWMVLVSNAVGVAIEAWKLRKAVAVNLTWRGWWPTLTVEDREASYSASGTKAHDAVATSHMLVILAPLVVGYAVFSLLYERVRGGAGGGEGVRFGCHLTYVCARPPAPPQHRSWYSWILTSTTGFSEGEGGEAEGQPSRPPPLPLSCTCCCPAVYTFGFIQMVPQLYSAAARGRGSRRKRRRRGADPPLPPPRPPAACSQLPPQVRRPHAVAR